jgi:hypothetical protein
MRYFALFSMVIAARRTRAETDSIQALKISPVKT